MKKVLKVLLICTIILGCFCVDESLAKEKNEETTIAQIENSIVAFQLYNNKSAYSIGEPIVVLEETDGKLNTVNYATTYPVYEDGKLILYSSLYEGVQKTFSISKDDVGEITSETRYAILVYKEVAFLVTEKDAVAVTANYGAEIPEQLPEGMLDEVRASYMKVYKSTQTIHPDNNSGTRTTFPIKGQNPYSQGCWAACMAAFLHYYKGLTNYTVSTVVNQHPSMIVMGTLMGDNAAGVQSKFDTSYHITTSLKTKAQVVSGYQSSLNNNKCYIITWFKTGSGAHMTCMYGYSQTANNVYSLNFMDPYAYASISSGGGYYTLTMNGSTFPSNNKLFGQSDGSYSFTDKAVLYVSMY